MIDIEDTSQSPRITPDLIAWMVTAFPNRLPADNCSLEHLRMLQGQQSVIDYLKHLKELQEEMRSV